MLKAYGWIGFGANQDMVMFFLPSFTFEAYYF
jgi:hypothetical protein